jgi:hypothetical protein
MLLKKSLHLSLKFLLLGPPLWLSNRPLLPLQFRQEALFLWKQALEHRQIS